MDVEMPIMGGLEATVRIREMEQSSGTQAVPIIGLSGNAREVLYYDCVVLNPESAY
jgi:CheY-like chemotaxis protein